MKQEPIFLFVKIFSKNIFFINKLKNKSPKKELLLIIFFYFLFFLNESNIFFALLYKTLTS